MRTIRFRDDSDSVRTGRLHESTITTTNRTFDIQEVDVLPPTDPTKILGVGPNYYSNIEHYGRDEPEDPGDLVLFAKTPNTIVSHGETAVLHPAGEFHYEAELGVVIGERCHRVDADDAMEYVEGYTCVNEITNKGLPDSMYDVRNRIRTKSFDNSSPIGPAIATPEDVPNDAAIELRLNGEVRQDDDISNLIFSVPELIEEITRYLTLEPGDVIATGSPEGVDKLTDGDRVEIEIDGIGTLAHDVHIPQE